MGAAWLQWQFLKLHTSALQSLAVGGYQTACTRQAVALLQWQDTKLHARVDALLQCQVLKLLL
jgi:hypothetical protein